jgi:hypothetical protein
VSPLEQPTRLTSAATDIYMASSLLAMSLGALSWEQYLLRLQFVRENAESDSLQADTVRRILGWQEFESEEEWPFGEREQTDVDGDSSSGTQDSSPPDDDTTVLHFIAENIGLSNWLFHKGDDDFFPSIPHGHGISGRRSKLDAYRGWIYQKDTQVGREPRGKIVALWNDEKFRAFATAAITNYALKFPSYHWRVHNPMRLPHRR